MKNNNGKCLEKEDLSKIFPDFEYYTIVIKDRYIIKIKNKIVEGEKS